MMYLVWCLFKTHGTKEVTHGRYLGTYMKNLAIWNVYEELRDQDIRQTCLIICAGLESVVDVIVVEIRELGAV